MEHIQKILTACGITLDCYPQRLSQNRWNVLLKLAHKRELPKKIRDLMYGENVNSTENKPALHTALRSPQSTSMKINEHDIIADIAKTQSSMQRIADSIRAQQWLGQTGQPIKAIVNIGIGGSDLGPRFALQAFQDFALSTLTYHFISDADPYTFQRTVASLSPETTLFIITSKSFTTKETLYNTKKAMHWIGPTNHDRHFIAITANTKKALEYGITTILPIWDWVGGRYSFCSAVNLITAIAIGHDKFSEMLHGAYTMDAHFLNMPLEDNLPVVLALLGIWNNNALDTRTVLMLTYGAQLDVFVPFIQQLDMESNGKSINIDGEKVPYATGPIIWGGPGNQAQHSYYQLLCQGTHKIGGEFITIDTLDDTMLNHFCRAKVLTLRQGIYTDQPLFAIPGKIPIHHIRLSKLTPFTIGALVALYEHKIFAQSVIWNINPFDQPGVASAKTILFQQSDAFSIEEG